MLRALPESLLGGAFRAEDLGRVDISNADLLAAEAEGIAVDDAIPLQCDVTEPELHCRRRIRRRPGVGRAAIVLLPSLRRPIAELAAAGRLIEQLPARRDKVREPDTLRRGIVEK